MSTAPAEFSETVGGFVLLAGVASTFVSFRLLRDRWPRFTAVSLFTLAVGSLFASHWVLVTKPGDHLDQMLSRPIGVLVLIGALVCLVWGTRKLRAAPPTGPTGLSRGTDRTVGGQSAPRTPLLAWVASVGAALVVAAVVLMGPFDSGVWRTKHAICSVPADQPCTLVLVGFSIAIGFLAGLLVYFAASRLLRWKRARSP